MNNYNTGARSVQKRTKADVLKRVALLKKGKTLPDDQNGEYVNWLAIDAHEKQQLIQRVIRSSELSEDVQRDINDLLSAFKIANNAPTSSPEFILKQQGSMTTIMHAMGRAFAPGLLQGLANSIGRGRFSQELCAELYFAELHPKQINQLFQIFEHAGKFGEFFHELVNVGDSLIHDKVRRLAIQWHKRHPVKTDTTVEPIAPPENTTLEVVQTAPEIPAQEIAPPTPETEAAQPATGLKVVEVDTLLPPGEGEDMGAPGLYDGERDDEGTDLRTQPRIDWIVSALKDKGFEIADMFLYREKKILGTDPDRKPYVVLEALKGDHHFQIAICEIVGNATYIIKNPTDFSKDTVVTVADLKKDPAVFQTYCYAQDQWLQSTLNYAFTPLEELKEQLKTRIGWGDKKDAVENSFGLFYLETGQTPFTTDKSIIEYGPLAGKATWKRLYNALRRGDGAIPGLQHIKTFAQLRDHIFPEGIESPVREFDAREVFKNAVLHVKDTGQVPDLGKDFDRSLGAKKVSGLEDVVVGSADNVRSAKDFLAATGIAVQKTDDGTLQPSSPVVIGQLERFANTLPKQQPT